MNICTVALYCHMMVKTPAPGALVEIFIFFFTSGDQPGQQREMVANLLLSILQYFVRLEWQVGCILRTVSYYSVIVIGDRRVIYNR